MKTKRMAQTKYRILLLGLLAFSACKKDKDKIDPIHPAKIETVEFAKLLDYISITTTAPKSQIIYNEKKQEFIVYGWYHKSLADAQLEYSTANEYKAKYEK